MPEAGVVYLVLAAGLGARYRAEGGDHKLLAPLDATPGAPAVLQAVLAASANLAERRLVVVREDDQPLRRALAGWVATEEICLVRSEGLGHSLAQAVARCPATRGWLVLLGDMPYVRRETLVCLARAVRPGALVVPRYRGRPGHPRGIGADHRESLLALVGDTGARLLFETAPVTPLAVEDPGVLQDIDRPRDHRPPRD